MRVRQKGTAEGLEAASLRDFIREEVHDVVMMCESWRRRRMMRSLPGNHIPTFKGAKLSNQSPGRGIQCVCVCVWILGLHMLIYYLN